MGCCKRVYSGIGGQAVLEGIMMKNKDKYAIAVRKPDKDIAVDVQPCISMSDKYPILGWPFIRGIFSFIDSLAVGLKTITYSASFIEEEEGYEPDKFEKWLYEKFGEKTEKVIMDFALVIAMILAIVIFMLLPMFISNLLKKIIVSDLLMALIEGILRIAIFVAYIKIISNMEDIKRTFMYHGAEHKCINCVELGKELTVDNVMASSKEHKRCGTSFLIIVMIISILFFMVIRVDNLALRALSRIVLIPVIAGVSYEFLRIAGRSESKLVNALSRPGMWMQGLTTKEPTADMAQVAITATEAVFDWRKFLSENFTSSYFDLFDAGRIALFKQPEGEHDARELLLWACGIDMTELMNNYTTSKVDPEAAYKYRMAIKERASGVPLQHITHESNFCGLDLYVDEDVLIPRFDTEVLVETVLNENRDKDVTVLDLCTGSGCIAIALAKLGGYEKVIGADISRAALEIADRNASANGVDITYYESDMFSSIEEMTGLDIIVSNPPYIKTDVLETLMPEVRDHDPRIALDGDADGLKFYRIIAGEAPKHLKEGGKLYLEIGYDQASEVSALLEENGFKDIRVIQDLSHLDRVVCSTI